MNGYANLIGARLRKLADEGSTGMLPVSGPGDGAVFFRGGLVVYAESSRTPLPAPRAVGLAALGLLPTETAGYPDGPPPSAPGYAVPPGYPGTTEYPGGAEHTGTPQYTGGTELVAARSVSRVAGALALTEAVIDALTELMSSESRYAKFRHIDAPPAGQVPPLQVETLLAEVQRRHAVLRQLAEVLTPDTPVVRAPMLGSPAAQVSPAQWSLLARAADGTTPRGLAMHLGRSVFGTTIEVHRLTELGMLAVPGRPVPPPGAPGVPRPGPAVSFIRAVTGERGSDG